MSISDEVAKFLDGDVIVDRRNPFRNDNSDEAIVEYSQSVDYEVQDINPESSTSHTSGTVALPVRYNITGNILNLKERKEFQNIVAEQSPEDRLFIERFLRERGTDAYATLIRLLTMDNEKSKKKSLKDILPSFFSKNNKTNKSKNDGSNYDGELLLPPMTFRESRTISEQIDDGDLLSKNFSSDRSSSCSTLISEKMDRNSLNQSDTVVVNSTWKYKKPSDQVEVENELQIIESPIRSINETASIAVPQTSVRPKAKTVKPQRLRSLSAPENNNKINVSDKNKVDKGTVFEPQYAYVKPRSPTPSNSRNIIITKPTIHHEASPDNIPNKFNITRNIPQVLQGNDSDIECEIEYRQKQPFVANESNEYTNAMITSTPVVKNQANPNSFEHFESVDNADKLTREQKDRNLKNVEAFYWTQLTRMKMMQDEELKNYVMSTNDINNRANNNFLAVTNGNQAFLRSRSVSPKVGRLLTPVMSPTRKTNNGFVDSSLPNEFTRNTPIRNTIGSTSNVYAQRGSYDIRNNNLCVRVNDFRTMNTIGIPETPPRVSAPVYGTILKPAASNSLKPPIFKKGSLYPEPAAETPNKEKRVSFTQTYSQAPKLQSVHENVTFGVTNGTSTPYIRGRQDASNQVYGKLNNRNTENLYATVSVNVFNKRGQFDGPQVYATVNPKPRIYVNTPATNKVWAQRLNLQNNSRNNISADSESGSEAGEIQRIMQNASTMSEYVYEDWNPDGKNRGSSQSEGSRGRLARRDDPRRHTLGGDLLRSAPPHSALVRGMDIEHSLPRGYPPPSSAMLFDDDPGIMSEVETASTGFRRGGKQRSSLPVVRTPSKTLERPLGLVFLQYRSETKRALLPNEITSIDTVKALFVRSFPKQLTMEYLDSPLVKIYIHDSSKDMFYELEDLRSHLRDIRDRSVLRLFESADVSGGTFPGSLGTGAGLPPLPSGPPSWDQDQSYFSEPEFDSDYHHQHIHKSKTNSKTPAYYMGTSGPSTLPRGGSLIRAYSPATGPPLPGDRIKPISGSTGAPPKPLRAYGSAASVIRSVSERGFPFTTIDGMRAPDQLYSLPADRIHNDGYMSSPERGSRGAYEEPYYTQYVGPRGGMTPVIDEETGDASLLDDQYSLYSVKIPSGSHTALRPPPYDPARLNTHSEDLQQRMRVEHMERQLANLTGLVQKALQAPVATPAPRGDFLPPSAHFRTSSQESVDPFLRNERPPKLGKGRYHKSVSFEKSVSFSDEPPDMNSPKQHSPQHATDSKPPKPAIKSSTLPRMSSQERDRLKPIPPPKPKTLVSTPGLIMPPGQLMTIQSIEYQNYLKGLLKKCKELRMDMRNLRRLTLTQAHTMREMICDTFVKFRTATSGSGDFNFHEDSMRLAREEEIYKQEMLKLEADLCDLENTVEQLRGSVINRKTRVNMVDVERMALVLSKSSKTVADLKVRFPSLQDGIKGMLGNEMEKVVREEKFLKEEPERLELALRRCKKLTGTLVTLKRLANVQEKRHPCDDGRVSPGLSMDDIHTADNAAHSKMRGMGESGGMAISIGGGDSTQRSENALDALLDELQTFARPPDSGPDCDLETDGEGERGLLRRLRAATSPEPSPAVIPRGLNSGKPPVPERNPELLQLAGRRAPPPPPPRTSSRSPLASPAAGHPQLSASNSSSCDSVDSQEGARARQEELEQRHQELLRKQRSLQEQFARLQQMQRGGNSLAVVPPQDLKKTGSESNLVTKLGLNMAPAAPISGSLTHLARPQSQSSDQTNSDQSSALPSTTTSKVYETDIL